MSQTPPAGGPPSGGAAPAQGGGSPLMGQNLLVQLGQTIRSIANLPGMNPQGIKMMMDGLKMLQTGTAAASTPPPQAAPPR